MGVSQKASILESTRKKPVRYTVTGMSSNNFSRSQGRQDDSRQDGHNFQSGRTPNGNHASPDSHEHTVAHSDSSTSKQAKTNSTSDSDESEWQRFMDDHGQEFADLENSRTARHFERKAHRIEEKETRHLLDAADLRRHALTHRHRRIPKEEMPPFADASDNTTQDGPGHGPRDFETSFLDIDAPGEAFAPSDGKLGHVRLSTLVFTIAAIVGLILVVLSLFLPMPAVVAGIGGALLLIGAVGLFSALRGHSETRHDPNDSGARI